MLHAWEEEYSENLTKMPFVFLKAPMPPKPFRKDDTVQADIVCRGRLPEEMIAVASGRAISVPKCDKSPGNRVNLKILRAKDNIYMGKVVSKQRR